MCAKFLSLVSMGDRAEWSGVTHKYGRKDPIGASEYLATINVIISLSYFFTYLSYKICNFTQLNKIQNIISMILLSYYIYRYILIFLKTFQECQWEFYYLEIMEQKQRKYFREKLWYKLESKTEIWMIKTVLKRLNLINTTFSIPTYSLRWGQ